MTFATGKALRAAVRDKLVGDAALIATLGGAHVYDEAPRNQATPYIIFTQSEARDRSTMTEQGAEHFLTLEVWSKGPGAREALEIVGRVASVLHDAHLAIPGAVCIYARIVSIDTQRQSANRFVRARLKLRALVELEH
jgi:hypothetical protein